LKKKKKKKLQSDFPIWLTFRRRRRHTRADGARVRRNSKLVTPAVDEVVADLSSPATIYAAGTHSVKRPKQKK
jgi:hypothetical protein